ncbi:MAG TPA: MOSC domain-containing protein [Elusimicrobia bacterium]|jgi:MOSC domain-containing protein YiiM|nr:MOSC domain-containing protein [Elusimicrobiota bacterium]
MEGKIISVNSSKEKGTTKKNIHTGILRKNYGLVGDAHSGTNREVSLLGWERVLQWLKVKSEKLKVKVKPGNFAENITTEGIDWSKVKIGDRIKISPQPIANSQQPIILEVSQIGKECHSGCAIRKLVGDCLMPKEGIFAKVLQGGKIKVGNRIIVESVRCKV